MKFGIITQRNATIKPPSRQLVAQVIMFITGLLANVIHLSFPISLTQQLPQRSPQLHLKHQHQAQRVRLPFAHQIRRTGIKTISFAVNAPSKRLSTIPLVKSASSVQLILSGTQYL